MKSKITHNRRLIFQFLALTILAVLPISMIVANGMRAFQGIMTGAARAGSKPDSSQNESEPGMAFRMVARDSSAALPDARVFENTQADVQEVGSMLKYGVYDPLGEFDQDIGLKLRHVYVSWASFDAAKLKNSLTGLESHGFEVLLTIEPWPKKDATRELLPSILASEYDSAIDQLATVLSGLQGPVYVSWGHEMDQDLTQRYPWSGSNPDQFVSAYRYVVDRFRKQVATEIHWIWAGVLKEGSRRYWPGDDYVDFVGMPIYSFPAWDQKNYGFIRDFKTTFEEKRAIVKDLDHPLIITELGVSGSPDFESFWLHQAFMKIRDYPDLAGVVFFYSRDTEGAWGNNIETPDWRVHPDSIRGLVEWNSGSRLMKGDER